MNPSREEVLLPLVTQRITRAVAESERVDVSRNTFTEHRQDRVHLFQSFPHPVPLDLKSVAVADDVPETAEGTELAGQRLVEQRGQRRLSGRAEPLEQVQVPVSRQRAVRRRESGSGV